MLKGHGLMKQKVVSIYYLLLPFILVGTKLDLFHDLFIRINLECSYINLLKKYP